MRSYWKQYSYDPATGLLSAVTSPEGTFEYRHDDYGQVTFIRTSTGQEYDYEYDALGNLKFTRSRGLPGAPEKVVQYFYDTQGRRTLVKYPNDTETGYTYDAFGRRETITHRKSSDQSNLLRLIYTRDRRGIIERLVEERPSGTVTWSYWYDRQKRLKAALRSGASTTLYEYAYDDAGNRLSERIDGVTTTYTYNSLGQLVFDGTFAYQYDTFCNLFRKLQGETIKETYSFDGANCLRKVANDTGQVVYLNYDEKNTRIGKRFVSGATDQTTCYLTDYENPTGLSQTLAEYNPSDPTSTRAYVYGAELIAQSDARQSAAFFHTDHLCSIRLLTDTAGATIVGSDFTYRPYGELVGGNGSLTCYAFTGQYRDADLNLQYHRRRWLGTGLASWLSVDTVHDFPANLGNAYSYAGLNPVLNFDPRGGSTLTETLGSVLISTMLCSIAGGAIAGTIGAFIQNSSRGFLIGAGIGAVVGAILGATVFTASAVLAPFVVFAIVLASLAFAFVRMGYRWFSRQARPTEVARLRGALDGSISDLQVRSWAVRFLETRPKAIYYTNDSMVPFWMAASLGSLYVHGEALRTFDDARLVSSLIHEFVHMSGTGDNAATNSINVLGGARLTAAMEADAFAVQIYFEEQYLGGRGFGRDMIIGVLREMSASYASVPTPQEIEARLTQRDRMEMRLREVLGIVEM